MDARTTRAECGKTPLLTFKGKPYTLQSLLVHKFYENSGCPFSHLRSTGQGGGAWCGQTLLGLGDEYLENHQTKGHAHLGPLKKALSSPSVFV